jgi:hypothetical protein
MVEISVGTPDNLTEVSHYFPGNFHSSPWISPRPLLSKEFPVMKNSIFWDITPWNPLKFTHSCGEIYCLHLQCRKIRGARTPNESSMQLCLPRSLALDFLLGAFYDPEDGTNMFFWKVANFQGLQSVIPQKIKLFITTAVRPSNPTDFQLVIHSYPRIGRFMIQIVTVT